MRHRKKVIVGVRYKMQEADIHKLTTTDEANNCVGSASGQDIIDSMRLGEPGDVAAVL